jgi:eukaryotic-like serine/threonine-protein kinase
MTTPPAADPGTVLRDATAAMRQGNLRGASALAAAAEARFRARGDADGRMRAENLLGAVAWETGQVGDAERYFGTALELAHGLDDSLMTARASNNLASVAHLTGRPDLALSLYRTALLSYQRLGDRRGMAETSHNLGIAFRQLGQWTDAERAAEEAVRHADQSGDAALRGLALVGLAELHLELKAWPLAEREIERAAVLAAEGDDPIGVAEAGRLRALLHLGLGHAVAALGEALAARDEAHRLGTALLEAECTTVAARAARAIGNGDQAEELRAEAEAGLTRLGAAGLLERLRKQWGA